MEAEKVIKVRAVMAEQRLSHAEQGVKSAKSLLEKNIITGLQARIGRSADGEFEASFWTARGTKLSTLAKQTKAADHRLDAQLASQEANVKGQQGRPGPARRASLRDIQDQIEKCTIKATAAGQVV